MIINIMVMCRSCWKMHHTNIAIASWSQVKTNLNVQTNWKCGSCRSKAAYWCMRRDPFSESLSELEMNTVFEEQGYWQCFGCTAGVGLPIPDKFVPETVDPVTRVEL